MDPDRSLPESFPVSRPAYRHEHSTPSPGVVAIDMRRCPVADYLAAHDARELCVGTWCNLDFALAMKRKSQWSHLAAIVVVRSSGPPQRLAQEIQLSQQTLPRRFHRLLSRATSADDAARERHNVGRSSHGRYWT